MRLEKAEERKKRIGQGPLSRRQKLLRRAVLDDVKKENENSTSSVGDYKLLPLFDRAHHAG